MAWRRWGYPARAGTPIRAVQISSLRTAIDQALAAAGLPSQAWTWPNVVPGDRVLACHCTEMCDAIQRLWTYKGRGPLPNWTSGVTPGGPSVGTAQTSIRATDITDLRTWFNQYEVNGPPAKQGIDTKSYDPADANRPCIQNISENDWPGDIANLSPTRLMVRCNATGHTDGSSLSALDLLSYATTLNYYADIGCQVFVLLTNEFYQGPEGTVPDPNAPLDANYTNPYITMFASRGAELAQYLYDNTGGRVVDYIIWNEPNEPDTRLEPDRFAALLVRCWNTMTAAGRIYCGGINFGPGVDGNALQYIDNTYAWAQTIMEALTPAGQPWSWPWDGINLHLHNWRSQPDVDAVFTQVKNKRDNYDDAGEVVIGEWGLYPLSETHTNPA